MAAKRDNAGPSNPQKRARFVSPSPGAGSSTSLERGDDSLLEEDLPEGAANVRAKSKRQVKDQDGYGSDSSNDDEGVVPSRRTGAIDDDEDVDMFADDVEDDKGTGKGKGKGKVEDKEFMDLEQIEGQEFDRRRVGTEDDSDSEEETDERKFRKKVKEADLGFEVTPFNMKAEMDEGRFTADGESYMANERDPGEKHDMWLDDVDKEEIRKAKRAHREREKAEREKEEREDGVGRGKERENELMREAVGLMQRGETVLETLQRLGKEVEEKTRKEEAGQKKKSWAERQKERKAAMAVEQEQADSIHTSNPFTNLSNIVSALTAIGHLDVYSLSRESLQRMLPAPPTNGSSSTSIGIKLVPRDDRRFQYRFSMKFVRALPEAQRPVEREIFGPFSVQQLQHWRGTGFFGGPACENVELRIAPEAGEEATAWGSWSSVVGF